MNFLVRFLIISWMGAATMLQAQDKPPYSYDLAKAVRTPSGLSYVIVQEGTGALPKAGEYVNVHYHGLLQDGKKFDSSFDRGHPFKFKLGSGMVIRGWDEGLALLKVGTKAVLIVPPELGYGKADKGNIPPNSTLYFHIEVMGTKAAYQPLRYDESQLKTTASGMKYVILQEGSGPNAVPGDKVSFHYYTEYKGGQSVLNSYDNEQPMNAKVDKQQLSLKGWEEALTLLKAGGKGVFVMTPDLAFGGTPPSGIPKDALFVNNLELLKIEKEQKFTPWSYDAKNAIATASGLKYVIIEEGKGPKAEVGKEVSVHYHGTLMDGKKFDSSFERGDPFSFTLGQGQVIRGWDEGIALLKKGTKAVLIIPPQLGYGEQGAAGAIPPNATLIFYVHLQ